MSSMVNLDVLVVYSAGLALSASVEDSFSRHPFLLDSRQANYNLSYAYFLEECKKCGLTAGFTTSSDIIGPGTCKTYWTLSSGTWQKVNNRARSFHVFDKISPTSSLRAVERNLLFSNDTVIPFNDAELFVTFFDKLRTYRDLPDYAIPTVEIISSQISDLQLAIRQLNILLLKHRYPSDFSKKFVLKDRFGAGGNHVYKISRNFIPAIRKIMLQNAQLKFVLQPFLEFDKGYSYKDNPTATDIRLIFHHNDLLQCYVRMAKDKDFRCNEHQGGKLVYISEREVPELIRKISKKIVKNINKSQSLYALDFVVSNRGKIYFIEGNIGPGIDWDVTRKINERMSKQLIRSIVSDFALKLHKPAPDYYNNLLNLFPFSHNYPV